MKKNIQIAVSFSEKTATDLPKSITAFLAILNAKAVFPTAGRAPINNSSC